MASYKIFWSTPMPVFNNWAKVPPQAPLRIHKICPRPRFFGPAPGPHAFPYTRPGGAAQFNCEINVPARPELFRAVPMPMFSAFCSRQPVFRPRQNTVNHRMRPFFRRNAFLQKTASCKTAGFDAKPTPCRAVRPVTADRAGTSRTGRFVVKKHGPPPPIRHIPRPCYMFCRVLATP